MKVIVYSYILSVIVGSSVMMPAVGKTYDCSKKTCSQMESCEEAKYKLKVCKQKNLDRDKDGVPCEKICPGG